MDFFYTLRALCLSGIQAGAATTWRGSVRVWLGEEEDKVAFAEVESFGAAARWLDESAKEHFPASDYAKVRRFLGRIGAAVGT